MLHATGHIRTIRETFPGCHITLLTASPSHGLFTHNTNIDRILVLEKDKVKREWKRHPVWAIRHIASLIKEVRTSRFDLAFDLQGRLKSVIFLYTAKAHEKFVKGRWLFVKRFKKPEIHAIKEMDHVLALAGISVKNSDMEIHTSTQEQTTIENLLYQINPTKKKILIISPFTRWKTKNWEIQNFRTVIDSLHQDILILLTGLPEKRQEMDTLVTSQNGQTIVNLAGKLTLLELAELLKHANVVLTGDSFPMHLASALHTPLIALFGPTDEDRIGPVGKHSSILRAGDMCQRCYRRDRCTKNCINDIPPERVIREVNQWLSP